MSEKKLFLLDGHALVYRAHFSFITRPLINSKGMNVSAITGFVRTLWDILNNQKPTHIAVSFDLPEPTFRHIMYEPYKANREKQPEDISLSFPYIFDIVKGFNIPIVTAAGFEADDVIGTLSKQAEKEGFKVYMMTPDKDYAQLVSENIFMYKPGRKGGDVEIMGVPEVLEKWGINRVDQVIDMLGMQGDSVDNIPGIPGIGPKTAQKLIQSYDSLENLIEHSHELKGKQKERIEEFAEQGLLSKKLATIDLNVPVQFDAKSYEREDFNRPVLAEIFKELEFRRLAQTILGESTPEGGQQDLFGNAVASKSSSSKAKKWNKIQEHSVADKNIENTAHDYKLIDTPAGRADLIKKLADQKSICFDTETTGLDANQATLVGLAFSYENTKAFYVPIPADQDEAKAIVREFKAVLENPAIEKIGQNIKYDILMLKWYDVEVAGSFFDTMIAHYLCEPDLRHKLDYLTETYLKYKMVPIESLIGKKGKNQLSMRDIAVDKVAEYAGEDADLTFQLKAILSPKLEEESLLKLYTEIEEPLIRVLADMEHAGIKLDADYLYDYAKEIDLLIAEKEKGIYEEAEVRFNIASPKQVGEVLFDKMKIPYRWRKTKTGQYSTDETKLSELALEYPFVASILRYRGLAKLKSTYVDSLPRMLNPKTGRIHSSFNQALAATGRLSSNNPNLQNIPIRTAEGRRVRKAFVPENEDYILLAADYSQIELRLIAEISGDEAMLQAFKDGKDIHRATAANVYDVPFEEVTPDQRRNAKTVNFSIIYGAGSTNLSQQLKIKRAEAKKLIEQYFNKYQGLKSYMEKTVEFARENGYVKTLLGRRRYLRDINSGNSLIRSNAERIAVNTPIQGTAADMIKIAMINIHQMLKEGGYRSKMILQVHDELVFDVHLDELEVLKPLIEEKMKTAIPDLQVPILVGMDTGKDWLEAH
ncbi:MAG: DNA polymerase I [Saprospiraceae bacterium]